MTSSLVGSEMCIRDRARASPRIRIKRCSRDAHQTQQPEDQHQEMQRTCSVSYTHLTLPTICSV
eukprot:4942272-Prorocentrum_lima.AAC.1